MTAYPSKAAAQHAKAIHLLRIRSVLQHRVRNDLERIRLIELEIVVLDHDMKAEKASPPAPLREPAYREG